MSKESKRRVRVGLSKSTNSEIVPSSTMKELKSLDASESLSRLNQLNQKPRKEQVVTMFHDLVGSLSSSILMSGVSQNQIDQWLVEPWSLANLNKASEWVTNYLMPPVFRLIHHIDSHDSTGWVIIRSIPTHPEMAKLRRLQRDVRDTWKLRPRFPEDKFRVNTEGY